MKKVGILTLGLKDNYGGILQAAALYSFLEQKGYEPFLINKHPFKKKWKILITRIFELIPIQNYKNFRISNIKFMKNQSFFLEHFKNSSQVMYSKKEIETYILHEKIDVLLVGSDQVWRYAYIGEKEYDAYFLNFNIPQEIKKISYAASFGISAWEAPEKSSDIEKYLSKFNAVSVREQSGIDICEKQFNYMDAKLVLDPTLLIDDKFYCNLLLPNIVENNTLVTYILDNNRHKINVVKNAYDYFALNNQIDLNDKLKIYSIKEWVSHISKANFVVTDSFHGMLFSIIFKKQFIVILNKGRGADRFYSMCNLLGLEDRVIQDSQSAKFYGQKIDYNKVYDKLNTLKLFSSNFLRESIDC